MRLVGRGKLTARKASQHRRDDGIEGAWHVLWAVKAAARVARRRRAITIPFILQSLQAIYHPSSSFFPFISKERGFIVIRVGS